MDNHATVPSETQQYQQYYQHYQQPPQPHQQQPEATNPSAYDPSTQSYYASVQPYNPNPHQPQEAQPDYSSYYYPDYSNSYQPQAQMDPNSIHPPGVTIPAEMPQNHPQNHRDVYFRHWFENLQQQQQQQQQQQRQQIVYMAPGYPTAAAASARGGRGGKPGRGGRHGVSRGRGRGRGRGGGRGTVSVNHIPLGMPRQGGPQPSSSSSAAAPGRMSWCEICKVDCNTPEVLEQHKNGKKHTKNLKVYQELQSCTKTQAELQIQGPDSSLAAAVEPENNEGGRGGSGEKQAMVSDAVSGNSNGGVVDIPKETSQEERVQIGGARGIKRKMVVRVGRGAKVFKSSNGSRKPAEVAKPKKTLDLFCDLCNVKCESQVVFNSHMAGKKHLSNIKKLQGHHHPTAASVVPEPLPSTLQALYPNASSATPENQQGAVEDSQAALVQLLNQHGIQDAQSLLSQMIPVLLNQVLPNVTSSAHLPSPLGNLTAQHISAAEKNQSEIPFVDQSVHKTHESVEGDNSNSTGQASIKDGREDNELVAGGEQAPENSTNQVVSLSS